MEGLELQFSTHVKGLKCGILVPWFIISNYIWSY